MAARFASALIEQGIQKGDRVVIVNPNSVETIVALFGILKAGGVFLVVHHSIKEKKLSYILNDCGCTGNGPVQKPDTGVHNCPGNQ